MPYQLVVSLEFQVAFLTLVTKTRRPRETPFHIIHQNLIARLVLIGFPRFLPGVLEPHHNDSWSESQQLGQVLQIVIFGIGILVKELLEHFNLVVREAGPVGSFPMDAHILVASRREALLMVLRRAWLRELLVLHVGVGRKIVQHLAEAVWFCRLSKGRRKRSRVVREA